MSQTEMQHSERPALIEQLFERDAAHYPDVRRFARPAQIKRRLEQLVGALRLKPPKKLACRTNRPLLVEYSMLRAKLACLAIDPVEDLDLLGLRGVVEATNAGGACCPQPGTERDRYARRAHTTTLMYFIFAKYSDAQLREMLAEPGLSAATS